MDSVSCTRNGHVESEVRIAGLEALQELSLSSNRLVSLPEGLLAPTRQLRNIDLYDNELNFLPRALFAGLVHLEEVARLLYS